MIGEAEVNSCADMINDQPKGVSLEQVSAISLQASSAIIVFQCSRVSLENCSLCGYESKLFRPRFSVLHSALGGAGSVERRSDQDRAVLDAALVRGDHQNRGVSPEGS